MTQGDPSGRPSAGVWAEDGGLEKEALQQGEGYWQGRGAQRGTPSQDISLEG